MLARTDTTAQDALERRLLELKLRKRFAAYRARSFMPLKLTFGEILRLLTEGKPGAEIARRAGSSGSRIERMYNACFKPLFDGKSLRELRKIQTCRRNAFPPGSAPRIVMSRARRYGCVVEPIFGTDKTHTTASRRLVLLNGQRYLIHFGAPKQPVFHPTKDGIDKVAGVVFVIKDGEKMHFFVRSSACILAGNKHNPELHIRFRPRKTTGRPERESWEPFRDAWPIVKETKVAAYRAAQEGPDLAIRPFCFFTALLLTIGDSWVIVQFVSTANKGDPPCAIVCLFFSLLQLLLLRSSPARPRQPPKLLMSTSPI